MLLSIKAKSSSKIERSRQPFSTAAAYHMKKEEATTELTNMLIRAVTTYRVIRTCFRLATFSKGRGKETLKSGDDRPDMHYAST
jgi:hypothetical protein